MACGLGFFALAFIIAGRAPGPTWDEHFNGRYLRSLSFHSLSTEFFRKQQVSVGPGYFLFLRLFTDGRSIAIETCRWFSLGFLLAVLLLLDAWATREKSKLSGWFFLGVPLVTAMAGYAMSDLMGLFLFLAALFLLRAEKLSLPQAMGAGLLLGAAALTRQVYLAGILLAPWLFVSDRARRVPAVVFALTAVAVPLPLFIAWGGLLPPFLVSWQPRVFSLPFLVLAFGETALVLLFFSPAFSAFLKKWPAPLAIPAIAGMATMDLWMPYSVKYVPLGWVIRALFPASFIAVGRAVLALTLFAGAGLFFYWVKVFRGETDPVKRGWLFVALAFLVAPAFHTVIYSVRYVLAPVVLLLLYFASDITRAKWPMARWSLGVLAGLTVLAYQTRAL